MAVCIHLCCCLSRCPSLSACPNTTGFIITCGDGVHIWDAGTVQLLHDLGLPDVAEHAGDAAGGVEAVDADHGTFNCVAYSGNVLAAGEATKWVDSVGCRAYT